MSSPAVVNSIVCPIRIDTMRSGSSVVDSENANPSGTAGIDGESCRLYCLVTAAVTKQYSLGLRPTVCPRARKEFGSNCADRWELHDRGGVAPDELDALASVGHFAVIPSDPPAL